MQTAHAEFIDDQRTNTTTFQCSAPTASRPIAGTLNASRRTTRLAIARPIPFSRRGLRSPLWAVRVQITAGISSTIQEIRPALTNAWS